MAKDGVPVAAAAAPTVSAPVPAAPVPAAPSPREQLAQQLANADGSGSLFSQLAGNPFFTAGFGLAALGVAVRWGGKTAQRGAALLRRRLLVDVEITRHDTSYQWFLQWMKDHAREQMTQSTDGKGVMERLMQRLSPGVHHLSVQTMETKLPNGAMKTHFSMVPGPGMHILRYKGAFMAVSRERDVKNTDLRTGEPFETIKMTTLYAYRHIFEDLFREAHARSLRAQEGKTLMYTSWSTEWKQFGQPKRKRPLDSVVLEDGLKDKIVDDVRSFIKAREWYLDRGIPYRRGYMLYGPPGTGKSSFIEALAGELDFNIAMLHLSERGLTDDRLNVLLATVPPRTLLLLEDADAAFNNRTQSDEHGYRGATVTFSGLLNALDGVASAEERIIFMTTNHIETMDEALIRPGRVDMMVRLGEASESQIRQLWDRFYGTGEMSQALRLEFVAQLKKHEFIGHVSTAMLQGLFLFHKDTPEQAIQAVQHMNSKSKAPQD